MDGVELRRPGTSGVRGGGAHLESWCRKTFTQKKQVFYCPGLVNGQSVTLITCYLVDVGKPRGEEIHGRKIEKRSQHNTFKLATRGKTLRADQLYVCLGTNLRCSSRLSGFLWAHGAMPHSVLRTGGVTYARRAARMTPLSHLSTMNFFSARFPDIDRIASN